MSIIKNIARWVLRSELETLGSNLSLNRDLFAKERENRIRVDNELTETKRLAREQIERLESKLEKGEKLVKMIEQRYDEQRRFNADLLESCKALDVSCELMADKRTNSQKIWLHAKIHFDRRLVQTFEKSGELPSTQALALVLARDFYRSIMALKHVFLPTSGRSMQVNYEQDRA